MSPDEYCQQKTAQSGSSFYYSFLFLPPEKRRSITAFYAYCREVDDVVDNTEDPSLARIKIAWWRKEIDTLYAGTPQHLVAQALVPVVKMYGLEINHLHEILDGMEADLIHHRYQDFPTLLEYCHQAAGVVGICAARIFGHRLPATLEYAHQLGLALQLTNIIRDVGEDARRGRIYLPIDELEQFGVSVADILNGRYSPEFIRLMQYQFDRAQQYYDQAFSLLPHSERQAQIPGLMMGNIYRTLLHEIRHAEFQVLHQRISLTPIRKLWLAWKTKLMV